MSTKKLAESLTEGQKAVLRAFSEFGAMDDTPLTIYVHHVSGKSMSSSGIRSRRAELVRKGLLTVAGIRPLKSSRNAVIHGITARGEAVDTRLAVQESAAAV